MAYAKSMQVLNSIHELNKNTASSPFVKSNLVLHKFEKLSIFSQLKYQIDCILGLNPLIELYNIGMSNYLHDLYFTINSLPILIVFQTFLIDYFYSNFLTCSNMCS